MEEQINYPQNFGTPNTKIRDIEETQRILKDRVLLLGQNLIEIRERTNNELLEIKKDLEMIKQDTKRMKKFLEVASGEFSKFAKKEELEILMKQAKMFQPLDFVRKSELKKFNQNESA